MRQGIPLRATGAAVGVWRAYITATHHPRAREPYWSSLASLSLLAEAARKSASLSTVSTDAAIADMKTRAMKNGTCDRASGEALKSMQHPIV